MKKRGASKNDFLASEHLREKIEQIGLMAEIEQHIRFSALASEIDSTAPKTLRVDDRRTRLKRCLILGNV